MSRPMPCLAALPLVALLCTCTAAPADDATRGADWSVTYDLSSWGMPMAHWQVNGDSSGEVWRTPGMSLSSRTYDREKYRLRMGPDAMVKFVALSDRLKQATRRPIHCQITITDQPYGTMTWRSSKQTQRYDFNFGCTSDKANAAYDLIEQAHDAVEKLADIEPRPYAVEHVGDR